MTNNPDINTMAADAMRAWQEQLNKLGADPKAKADLAEMMEPARRMWAEWVEKSQAAMKAAPADDSALRIAQLTLHVAELEKRVAKLEAAKNPKK